MKLRYALITTLIAIVLSACSFTLAEDVTPPPGYVPPTPMPTLGPLYPASAPNLDNGAAIYVEKCAPCHGHTGLGDGDKGKELPITVPALGVAENGMKAIPSKWYATVTQGNLDRFMPPFNSLNDQQRWDVVAYALSLHTTQKQLQDGQALFESSCSDCASKFTDQKRMAELSENDIINLIRKGDGDIPAFGKDFTDEEAAAVAAYIRTLTFAAPQPTPTAAPATATPAAAEAGTPSAEGTATEGTPQAEAATEAPLAAGFGNITGTVKNLTGVALPADLKVTLRGYEHGSDASTGPQEILTLESKVNADGTYTFEGVEFAKNRLFVTEVNLNGITYQSDFTVADPTVPTLVISDIAVYKTTEDLASLSMDALQIYFDFASEDTVQIFAVYTLRNSSAETITVNLGDSQEVPFLSYPKDSTGMGYEVTQDSANFVQTDSGFAIPPSDTGYGLIAFATMPKGKEINVSQPLLLPVGIVKILVPEGVEVQATNLSDDGIQAAQNVNFHVYTFLSGFNKGDTIDFKLTGTPSAAITDNPDITQNSNLLIGIGALGLALILAGGWLYWRDRNRDTESEDDDEEDDDELDDGESVMDAIIALDDQHRSGKISDEAYQKRRAELKSRLKK